ncbi:MAG: Coq4 family protein [Methyloligellaceae bacterium]
MKKGQYRRRLLPRSPIQFVIEIGHTLMTVYWAIRLMLNRKDTKPTYKYCWHLDRVTFFRSQFEDWLDEDRNRIEFWKKRRLFVDDMPDPQRFKDYPKGTVGRAFFEMCKLHDPKGLLDLRTRRLEVLPEEKQGLDLKALNRITDKQELYERIVARRNIFMTSTHDLCHMLTGSNTEMDGEALVAKYQYRHLLVPQNWLNMCNSLLVHLVTLRWGKLSQIVRCFPAINRSASYLDLDYETIWKLPLRDVRRELGLPEEGFTPMDELGASLIDSSPAAAG